MSKANAKPQTLKPAHKLSNPEMRIYVGDCRDVIPKLPEYAKGAPEKGAAGWGRGGVDLIFADPPFNWNRAYDQWDDNMHREDYVEFTYQWLDLCINCLAPRGSIWVNIPDDTAAEIVMHLKKRGLTMINWCIWHYRFGQNIRHRFISSKVHALYFCKDPFNRTFNEEEILEPSDRATTYADKRTFNKKEGTQGKRLPMDVWYGKWWGRIQGNNKERRPAHDNQIPEVYLERVIRACSNEGDLVMDPFLGSGTTCTVAHELGRKSIGIEYSAQNAKSCFERIKNGCIRIEKDNPTVHVNPLFVRRGATPSAGE